MLLKYEFFNDINFGFRPQKNTIPYGNGISFLKLVQYRRTALRIGAAF